MSVNVMAEIYKCLNGGFKALNTNLTDCAKSLRKLAESCEKMKEIDDYWHSVLGPDAVFPGKQYDWVLVKIRDDPKLLKLSNHIAYKLPHIAEYRSDGRWWSQESDKPYGSDELPFEVVSWRPIPGDSCEVLYGNNGEEVTRIHHYE